MANGYEFSFCWSSSISSKSILSCSLAFSHFFFRLERHLVSPTKFRQMKVTYLYSHELTLRALRLSARYRPWALQCRSLRCPLSNGVSCSRRLHRKVSTRVSSSTVELHLCALSRAFFRSLSMFLGVIKMG